MHLSLTSANRSTTTLSLLRLLVTPTDLSVTKAMEGLAISHSQTNFPLPRELRDAIYDYILNGEHVESPSYHERRQAESKELTPRSQSTAHTYFFETNILRVNKAISEEAKKQL